MNIVNPAVGATSSTFAFKQLCIYSPLICSCAPLICSVEVSVEARLDKLKRECGCLENGRTHSAKHAYVNKMKHNEPKLVPAERYENHQLEKTEVLKFKPIQEHQRWL